MTILLLVAAQAGLSANNYTVDVPLRAPQAAPGWRDEFGGHTIDRTRWRFDTRRNATGWYNEEKQYYAADRAANARIKDGTLVIEARHERLDGARFPDWGVQDYTSARLVTRKPLGTGFYEIRAKLPCGRGIWPGIWLLPSAGRWPDAGEIDIMEMVGWEPEVVHATIHSARYNHVLGTQRGAQKIVRSACSAYHRYQLKWRPDAITIGVDDRGYLRVPNTSKGDRGAWPFTSPYDLILNVAVGGTWGGAKGIDDHAFPQRMQIDYVRYWPASR